MTTGRDMHLARDYLQPLAEVLRAFGLDWVRIPDNETIPGSYWGEPEAGLIGTRIFFRGDTPVHSVLHEACHVICMDPQRRQVLHTDAGGETAEEDAVCYLQILLAESVGISPRLLMADMDAWGYSFRLGCASAWFDHDAAEAHEWLQSRGLVHADRQPTFQMRMAS